MESDNVCMPLSRRTLAILPIMAIMPGGCRRDARKVIGMVPKGSTHTFWRAVHAGAMTAAQESGFQIEWNSPAQEGDRSRQIAIVESMINQQLAAIALAPVDRSALSGVVERAYAAGIPVAIFDSGIDTPKRVSYVATDNSQGGRIAAGRLGEAVNGKGTIAIISDMPGSASTTERDEGFQAEIRVKYPEIRVLPVQFCYADRAKALAVMENLMTAHADLAGVFADHENATAGAALALTSRANRSLKLVGFDTSEQLVTSLKEGWIDSLVVQNPFRMGYEVVRALVLRLSGGQPAAQIDTGATLVRADMLNQPEIHQLVFPTVEIRQARP
jgi:ribose transport system substrate-binding protein